MIRQGLKEKQANVTRTNAYKLTQHEITRCIKAVDSFGDWGIKI